MRTAELRPLQVLRAQVPCFCSEFDGNAQPRRVLGWSRRPSNAEAERISVTCPTCSAPLSVRRAYAGHHVLCKTCGHEFLVENIVDSPRATRPESAKGHLFDRLYGEPEIPGSTVEPTRNIGETSELVGELATLRAQRDQVRAELATREKEHARLQSEHDAALKQIEEACGEQERLKKEHARLLSEHDAALKQIEEACGEQERLKSELNQQRQDHEHLGANSRRSGMPLAVLLPERLRLSGMRAIRSAARPGRSERRSGGFRPSFLPRESLAVSLHSARRSFRPVESRPSNFTALWRKLASNRTSSARRSRISRLSSMPLTPNATSSARRSRISRLNSMPVMPNATTWPARSSGSIMTSGQHTPGTRRSPASSVGETTSFPQGTSSWNG